MTTRREPALYKQVIIVINNGEAKLKKKLLLLCLVVLTILWLVAWFSHVAAYNHMIEEKKEQVGEEIVDRLMHFKPVLAWGNGSLLFMIGFFMVIAWMGFLSELYRLRKGR